MERKPDKEMEGVCEKKPEVEREGHKKLWHLGTEVAILEIHAVL